MARPIFGKMRTIVLPAEVIEEPTTIKGYKELTGIDLTEIFDIDIVDEEGTYTPVLHQKSPRSLILIQNSSLPYPIADVNWDTSSDGDAYLGHISFNNDGEITGGFGFYFTVDQDNPTLEGITVGASEI